MRYTILFSILLLAILTGCGKPKFSSTPSLKFTSVNTTELRSGQTLQFTLSFTDAEGDISDSIFTQKIVPGCAASEFAQGYSIPSFPASKDQKGDILISFGLNVNGIPQVIGPTCNQNDTAIFKFYIRDLAKHISDTVSSPPIIIYK